MSQAVESIKKISFEGERGTGKSTLINGLVEELRTDGNLVLVNREIDTGKQDSSLHKTALKLHTMWEQQFFSDDSGRLEVKDAKQAETLAWVKFYHGVNVLDEENKVLDKIDKGLLICDRDLDTVVLYAAVEVFLSNPDKYKGLAEREQVISQMWGYVLKARDLPDLTFCLTTKEPEMTLNRSYLSKMESVAAFKLTPLQQEMQSMASELLLEVISMRQQYSPNNKVIIMSCDGKRNEEMQKVVSLYLNTKEHSFPEKTDYPVLSLRTKDGGIKVGNIEELANLVYQSASGSAFPSYEEVSLAFSNCVYSNASLVEWGNKMGMGELIFVAAIKETRTGTNPVHWVALQIVDREAKLARVIDTTPFNQRAKFGAVGKFHYENGIYRLEDIDGDVIYSQLREDFPKQAVELMQLAFLSQNSASISEALFMAKKIYKDSQTEEKVIFSGIRMVRILDSKEKTKKAVNILMSLGNKYPDNLILAREIARMIISKKIIINKSIESVITNAKKIIVQAGAKMSEEESEKFINYYQWILQL